MGAGREIRRVPNDAFTQGIQGLPVRMTSRLAFMTSDHHLVRDFVVREMPRQRNPIPLPAIANAIGLDLQKVSILLSNLERQTRQQPDGVYLSMEQLAFSDRSAQSGLFAFTPHGRLRR